MKGKFLLEGGPMDGEMRPEINMPPDRHRVAVRGPFRGFGYYSPSGPLDYVVAYTNGDVTVLQPESVGDE